MADASRKMSYRFGSRKLQLIKPSDYPSQEDISREVQGSLELYYAHGFMGNAPDARQNLHLSNCGKYLVYNLAAVVVVLNIEENTQRFFTGHNDDVTAVSLDRRENSSLVISGQTDPIDRPGEGKDLPKVWVWDLSDMSKVELIDKICWGFINKLQWSKKTGYIYVLCGDESQTLKVFNPEDFKEDYKRIEKLKGKKVKKQKSKGKTEEKCNIKALMEVNTMKEKISGFIYNDSPSAENVDELLYFGKRKFCYMTIQEADGKLKHKTKAISIMKLFKKGEKSFGCATFLKDGFYAVGGQSGQIFIGKEFEAISLIQLAHSKPIGTIHFDGENVYTGGFDRKIVTWQLMDDLVQFKDKKGKDVGLKKVDSKDVKIENSDMVFLPKAWARDDENKAFYVGTKSNQIVRVEEKADATMIVDGHDGQIWGIATHPTKDIYLTGAYDNAVKLWDANTLKCIQTYEFGEEKGKGKEVVTAAWANNGKCIAIGTMDSNIAVFSFDNETNKMQFCEMIKIPKKNKNAEEENVSYLRFSNGGKYLAAAHMDSNLYMFMVRYGKSGAVKIEMWEKGFTHPAAPTHVQWSEDGKMLKTLTRDYEVCHWKLLYKSKKAKHVPNIPDPDTVKWADDPLVAGWDVQGLYQKEFDGTDLNDATITPNGKLIVSGDDYGIVRLHNYPAIDPDAKKEYTGHAEFVVGVEMLRSGKQLISCGGADMAIFQWKVEGGELDEADEKEADEKEADEEEAEKDAPEEEEAGDEAGDE